MPVMF